MMNDGIAINFVASRGVERTFLASTAFFVLLILVFAGFEHLTSSLSPSETTDADPAHQILYLGIFSLVLVASIQRRGLGAVRAMPPLLALLLAWCLASAYWASAHGEVFRHAAVEILLTASILLSADTIGPERAFRYCRIVLAAILMVNWLSLPWVVTHLSGRTLGNWSGPGSQQNATATVCVITALLFAFTRNGRFNWIGWLVAAAALGFLAVTRSLTGLALFPITLLAAIAYRLAWRDGLSRAIFVTAMGCLLTGAAVWALYRAGPVGPLLDPIQLAKRTEIGQSAALAYFRSHPWLGTGFGAVANDPNGYLQLLISLGWTGLALALLAAVAEPLARLWPLDYRDPNFRALLFGLFVLFVLRNFMQSDFLGTDDGVWLALLLVLAALRYPDKSLTLSP